MRPLVSFFLGAFTVVALTAIGAIVYIRSANGFGTRGKPSPAEAWLARNARSIAMPKDAALRKNPVQNSEEVLREARAHWADHCAVCHANKGDGDTEMGRSLYPPAPDMRKPETQQKTDGELFYLIENGIRLTGMPAWGGNAGEEASWKLVHFVRHLPKLSEAEEREMEKLNPKSPEELREALEEERFLKGEESHEPKHHH